MYERAVELDPDFALGQALLARIHARIRWYFYDRTEERLATAKEAVDEELRLEPDLPEAHEAMGLYHYWGHLNYDHALAEFIIARQSQPNNSVLLRGIAFVQRRQGRMQDALPNLLRAAGRDPRDAPIATRGVKSHYAPNS